MADYFEHKVSVTLSLHAYQTIESDMSIFLREVNWAGFINNVIRNFKDGSNASIQLAVQRKLDQMMDALQTPRHPLTDVQTRVVQKLAEDYARQLRDEMHAFPSDKETTKKIRINNENFDDLEINGSSRYFSSKDYRQAGLYIKALLEDYARQTFSKREEIFFQNYIHEIDYSIANRKTVKLKYISRSGKESKLELIPYGIIDDKATHYHYFIGIQKSSSESNYQLFSLRLSRIHSISSGARSTHITQKVRSEIDTQIQEKGVSYLQEDKEIYQIALTSTGIKMYNSIFHLRPRCTKITPSTKGLTIYEFDCTEEQIQNYFFRFGKNARILSPESLRLTFQRGYNEAAKSYKEGN